MPNHILPRFSIVLNDNDIGVYDLSLSNPEQDGEQVHAVLSGNTWWIYNADGTLVTGLLSDKLIDYCKKKLPKHAFITDSRKYYFLLKESNNDG